MSSTSSHAFFYARRLLMRTFVLHSSLLKRRGTPLPEPMHRNIQRVQRRESLVGVLMASAPIEGKSLPSVACHCCVDRSASVWRWLDTSVSMGGMNHAFATFTALPLIIAGGIRFDAAQWSVTLAIAAWIAAELVCGPCLCNGSGSLPSEPAVLGCDGHMVRPRVRTRAHAAFSGDQLGTKPWCNMHLPRLGSRTWHRWGWLPRVND